MAEKCIFLMCSTEIVMFFVVFYSKIYEKSTRCY